ncbi:MAG: hypothetical protein HYZ48_00530 [Chlamydiales bacterium]|nr:hypothetical protein [Chlamydiales bacterium]
MKHLKMICGAFLGASLLLSANEADSPPSGSSLSSANAADDGQSLTLTGHVVLDHGLGKMTAEEALLKKQDSTEKEFPFSQIRLKEDVLLALKNNAKILCSQADLDFTILEGNLFAKADEKVVYEDTIDSKGGKPASQLQLKSREIALTFSKLDSKEKKVEYAIETIKAHKDVEMHYADTFHLFADQMLYEKSNNGKPLQGMIHALAQEGSSFCTLTHGADTVDADQIDFDLTNQMIHLVHPKGVLGSAPASSAQKGPLHFQAKSLVWDHSHHKLTLKGDVMIQDSGSENLQTEESLEIYQPLIEGKPSIKTIDAKGPTTLTYLDIEKENHHKILCHGNIHIDKEKLQATLDSPQTEGKVLPHHQIYYEEADLSIRANQASFEYSVVNDHLQPVSLSLKGAIRLSSLDLATPPRCGIADRLHYSLTTKTLILSANPGKKVLFWDESQNFRISATEVHITEDPNTQKQSIKGVGNVQFAFNAEENALLQQLFPRLASPHE